jgi:catechol 2,3-dioxygenase
VVFRDEVWARLFNDEANHRIAVFAFANLVDTRTRNRESGMYVSSFEHASFDDLGTTHMRVQEAGIIPALCLDHGMTVS